MTILVTGVAGFIGYHVTMALLGRGEELLGVDSLNSYYDPDLKQARLEALAARRGFRFQQLDIADRAAVFALVAARQDITRVLLNLILNGFYAATRAQGAGRRRFRAGTGGCDAKPRR